MPYDRLLDIEYNEHEEEEEEEEEEETLFDPKSTNVQITIPHISDIQFKQLCTHIYRHYVDSTFEVMWIRLRVHKLPRRFSSIVIACIYHPPISDNSSMREYIIATLDGILRRHPDCGIILIVDFNQLRDMFLRTQ